MINVFKILREKANKVSVFSNSLSRKFEIVLRKVKAVYITMSSTNIVTFALVLFFLKVNRRQSSSFYLRSLDLVDLARR